MTIEDHLNHVPDADTLKQIEQIRLKYIELETLIDTLIEIDLIPADVGFATNAHEKHVALDRLNESRMWAIKGLTKKCPVTPIPEVSIQKSI